MSAEGIREAVREAAGCLKGAQYLIERAYPDGDAPAGLLPVLVAVVAVCAAVGELKGAADGQ